MYWLKVHLLALLLLNVQACHSLHNYQIDHLRRKHQPNLYTNKDWLIDWLIDTQAQWSVEWYGKNSDSRTAWQNQEKWKDISKDI